MNLRSYITFPKDVISSSFIAIALLLIAQIGLPEVTYSQGVSVQNDGSKVAQRYVSGNPVDKALLLPRFTLEQRNAIADLVEGMVIYNTTAGKPQFYNGTDWKNFDGKQHTLGEEFGGGLVFYIDPSGEHGLIAATTDQQTSAKWGWDDKPVGANGKTIGTGQSNTDIIAPKSPVPDIAARICSDLELNGYNDWALPSADELKLMYENLKLKGLGKFANDEYWSSSETDFSNAWVLNFKTGIPIESNISKSKHVRAIRSF